MGGIGSGGSRTRLDPTGPESNRVGLFGGTFDPIHYGHLIAAEEARAALGLAELHFVPTHRSPHKLAAPTSSDEDRLAMVALAIEGNPAFRLSTLDVDRGGTSYSVELLALFADQRAAEGRPAEIFWIMGSDSFMGFATWRDPKRILEQARLGILVRPGYAPDFDTLERQLPGITAATRLIQMPPVGISGTDLRRRVAEGRPVRYQLPESVAELIVERGLYAR